MRKILAKIAFLSIAAILVLSACGGGGGSQLAPLGDEFTFGMILVGPHNDHGWTQAHYDAGLYVEQQIPGAKMIYLENVYSGSPAYPGTTTSQLAEQLVAQGAKLIIFNSDDMKDEATKFAQDHPDIYVIMASGDQVWADGNAYIAMENMTNIMGRMEYGKMIAGCTAALTSQTGKIGYLGPLINDETRRLASSAYLGAKYCWAQAGNDPAALEFKVTWIGFWFNIPGVTSDPTQVADDFFNSGYDVVISGIDTTEAITEAKKYSDAGTPVWAIPYDYQGACDTAPGVCLGVPYFNWGPAYAATIKTAQTGDWTSEFQWNGPDWANINNPDTSAVGFVKGAALGADASTQLDQFIADLAGGLNLWVGPINLQDGVVYLADGVIATDQQIWYLPQLLEGMEGQSVSE
ncbi:MAG: simple sugar transport system substrate-binding protein [Anaerolineaceae bacterium]|nr:MAG: simple sugar transport system substrate-binding protein [Anaerolineaceae bacterium]